jgi:hypothetical protein
MTHCGSAPSLSITSVTLSIVPDLPELSGSRVRIGIPLCLSEIKFAHTDDEVRQEMA